MRFLRDLLLNPVLTLCLALPLLGIGGYGLYDRVSEQRAAEHLARLRPAAEVRPGGAAYLEGRIAPDQPARRGGLVAWVREEYRSCGDSSCWVATESEAPPLRVVVSSGGGWSIEGGYALAATADTVAEARPGWLRGSVRSRGFMAGRPVVAVGRVSPDGRGLSADALYAGSRGELLAWRARALDRTGRWFGAMAAAGLVLLGVAWWQLRRFLREVATDRAREAAAAAAAKAARPPRRHKARRGR